MGDAFAWLVFGSVLVQRLEVTDQEQLIEAGGRLIGLAVPAREKMAFLSGFR